MRVIQLIDSLEAGGAERMAVNLANGLQDRLSYSGIVTTRSEGTLLKNLNKDVDYHYLNKKRVIDLKALYLLKTIVNKNQVSIIHAHGSSYFFAALLKLFIPKIRIVWHDHLGSRVNDKGNILIKLFSFLFSGVVVVNKELKSWAKENLWCENIIFLPNFAVKTNLVKQTILHGEERKRIVCLANLRHPKNHMFLLKTFYKSSIYRDGWTLHLIGKDNNDAYSEELKLFIAKNSLEDKVYIYGSKSDTSDILGQASIGVLASTSEGFPVTLLEYALANLPILTTNIGFCNKLINHGKTGLLFDPTNEGELITLLKKITNNHVLREVLSAKATSELLSLYSEENVCEKLKEFYRFNS